MATDNLYLTELTTTQAQKEPTINAALAALDIAVGGILPLSVAGLTTYTPTTEEARNPVIVATGALTANCTILIPVAAGTGRSRVFVVHNDTTGAFTLAIKTTAAGSTGVAVAQGRRAILYHDNTHVYDAVSASDAITPSARVYHSAAQSITNNTVVLLTFNSERYDTEGIHEAAAPHRLICQTAGKYLIFATIGFDANAAGVRTLYVRVNGVDVAMQQMAASPAGGTFFSISTVWDLAAGQYVELWVYQNSGGPLDVLAQVAKSPEFGMSRLGG